MSSPLYLLSGDPFLASEALERVRAEAATDPLSEVAFDAAAAATELLEALETPSLLGGMRLVVVHGAHELKKDQADALKGYLESPSSYAVLVLVAAGKTKLDDVAKKLGGFIGLDPPKGRRLVAWVREQASGHGLRLDDRGGWALIDTVGNELRDLDGALAQLVTALGPGARATAADVHRAFPRLADERIFAFTDAVGERRVPAAMTALRRLLDQGDEPLLVFGALVAHVRRLLTARRHADQGAGAVAAMLGMPAWRAERVQRQARSYREEELISAMGVLAETDLEMKGGDLPPEAALERAVVLIAAGESV